MKILGIESSAKAAGVAVCDGDKILGEIYSNVGLTHSQTIMPMCESILKIIGMNFKEIDAIAVSAGPGSFTGLRIGIAAVKGMAQAADKKCIAVSTLEAMTYNVSTFNGIICPVMDARCSQVYNALFDNTGEKCKRICDDRAISIEDLGKEIINLKKSVILVGDGADLCYNLLGKLKNLHIAPPNDRFQRASGVALSAIDKPVCDANELEPVYLRLPQAERERLAKEKIK